MYVFNNNIVFNKTKDVWGSMKVLDQTLLAQILHFYSAFILNILSGIFLRHTYSFIFLSLIISHLHRVKCELKSCIRSSTVAINLKLHNRNPFRFWSSSVFYRNRPDIFLSKTCSRSSVTSHTRSDGFYPKARTVPNVRANTPQTFLSSWLWHGILAIYKLLLLVFNMH